MYKRFLKTLLLVCPIVLTGACSVDEEPTQASQPRTESSTPTQGQKPEQAQKSARDTDVDSKKNKSGAIPTVRNHPIKETVEVVTAQQAADVVAREKGKLGLEGADDGLGIEGHTVDELGNEYYQVQQTYKGLPVFGASGVLEIEGGKVVVISGSWQPDIELDTNPGLDSRLAIHRALLASGESEPFSIEFVDTAGLVVVLAAGDTHLAWLGRIRVMRGNMHGFSGRVMVNANDARLLLKQSDIAHE